MSSLSIEGWHKASGAEQSTPVEHIEFYLNGLDHQHLEQAEEYLQKSHEPETMVDVDMATLELSLPAQYGAVSDCQLRVYLREDDQRGQFHLVAHLQSDGSLVYSNAVLIDQLI
ncbi:hypothetical protein F3I16_15120 [Pseudomonas sp. L-22-4S-12]|uniref:hypothetical protein n=1 Tax=Pseudomonas sp. L-22-4S-12 TaxID=2610893 RepID=UPI001329481B|nr:hypothetical protein [Pseudomonas sp. L-22-4S-12]MWV17373.1 hypothetical protein [Pseudomonas sp. L-22-4S-12]